jgi:hypothetical protein
LINLRLLHIFKSLTSNIFRYIVLQGVLMNKPDNSDGSRGQLTARIDTCHLLQIQPLGLEFRKPVKPILLPHLGLTKNESQWFLGYPVRPPGFSSCRTHGYVPAECIHVRIPGHTGWILGSYLHDIFQPRHSSFVMMTQLENHISQPCLTDSIFKFF